MRRCKRLPLLMAALVLAVSVALTLNSGTRVPAGDRQVKLEAAGIMRRCMDQIKGYKLELGLPISEEDWFRTGMIGDHFTGITTTRGALEAKRTTANPDMAALVVQLLEEAGVQPGDTVGAGFSGSFPAMNLAVLSACAALDVNLVYIASVGSSTYGANQPQLTFPDMAYRLVEDGLLPRHAAAVSLGGADDCGLDMDPELVAQIRDRLEGYCVPFLYEEDFSANLEARMELYRENGPISCFVGVGGNLTTSGLGENELSLTWGVVEPDRVKSVDEKSGLLQRYNAQGLPVIHLLNIRQLVTDYGLAYDPEQLPAPGESAVYQTTQYSRRYLVPGILLACALLVWGRRSAQGKQPPPERQAS